MFRDRTRLVEYVVVIVVAVLATYAVLVATNQLRAGSGGTGTSSVFDQILSRGSLRAGIPIAGLPVASRDANGNIEGFVPDMANEMAKGLGVRLEIVDTPAPDRIPFLQAGKIDFSIGTITLERAKVIGFTKIWAVDATAAAYLVSSGIDSLEDIEGKRLVVVTGATGDLVATERFPNNPIQRVDLSSTAVQAVLSGQADVVFDDRSALALATQANPTLTVGPALNTEPSGVMIPIGDYKWESWVNYFLDDFYSSGVSTCGCGRDLFIKWFKAEPLPMNFTY